MRSKKTMLNAVFSGLSLLVSSLMALLSTRTVLLYLGSDYNGLNSTITQFLSVLMLAESGFTVAALVKLYKPYGENDWQQMNGILSKSSRQLKKTGAIMLVGGTILAAGYALVIKTSVDYLTVLVLFLFSIISTAFNFAYTYKYRLVFQVSQTEYIIHGVTIIQNLVMHGGMIFLVWRFRNVVLARAFYMLCNIAAGAVIGVLAKNKFPQARYKKACSHVQITGTKDLLVSRIAGMCYNSLTVFYMSAYVGTVYTSIYAVYNSVVNLVCGFLQAMLGAPQNALGQVINGEEHRIKPILEEYEYIMSIISSVIFASVMGLIIPFVRIYTQDISDVNYIVPEIGVVLILTAALQIIHIPSGQCIELSGRFAVVKHIQLIVVIALLVFSAVGVKLYGFMGLLLAKLLTNVVLAVIEIVYAHTKILTASLASFVRNVIPNMVFAAVLSFAEYRILFQLPLRILGFVGIGIGVLVVNIGTTILFNACFNRQLFLKVQKRILSLMKRN